MGRIGCSQVEVCNQNPFSLPAARLSALDETPDVDMRLNMSHRLDTFISHKVAIGQGNPAATRNRVPLTTVEYYCYAFHHERDLNELPQCRAVITIEFGPQRTLLRGILLSSYRSPTKRMTMCSMINLE